MREWGSGRWWRPTRGSEVHRAVRSGSDRALQNAVLVSDGSAVDRRSHAPTSNARTAGRRSGTRARAAVATVSRARSVTSSARTGSSMRAGRPRRVKVSTMSAKGRGDTRSEPTDTLGAESCGAGCIADADSEPVGPVAVDQGDAEDGEQRSRDRRRGVRRHDGLRGGRRCVDPRSSRSRQPPDADVYPVDVAA